MTAPPTPRGDSQPLPALVLTARPGEAQDGIETGLLIGGDWYDVVHQDIPQGDPRCVSDSGCQVNPEGVEEEEGHGFTV